MMRLFSHSLFKNYQFDRSNLWPIINSLSIKSGLMDTPLQDISKTTYRPPILVCYGRVEEMTQMAKIKPLERLKKPGSGDFLGRSRIIK